MGHSVPSTRSQIPLKGLTHVPTCGRRRGRVPGSRRRTCVRTACRPEPDARAGGPGRQDRDGDVMTPEPEADRGSDRGFLGRVAGAVTERVVETVDPDIVLEHVDLNALLERVDLNAAVARIDLDHVLESVDLNALVDRFDLDALVA